MPDGITLLHLSDPQFGRNHRFGQPSALFDHLSDCVKGQPVQVIVISGDLAEWGLKSEFDQALEFLAGLCELLRVSRRRVVLVPGNHDINRKQCAAYFAQCEANEEKPVAPYYAKWKQWEQFFHQFYSGAEGITFTPVEPWTFWEMPDLRLAVAGLNSTIRESHEEGTHYGWVGEQQLRWFRDRLAPYQDGCCFRLGVVHHNCVRGAQDDDENLRDADDLRSILGPSLDMLLHGHTHLDDVFWLSQNTPILATGSAALKPENRPSEEPNAFQLIDIASSGITRRPYRYVARRKQWVADPPVAVTQSKPARQVHGLPPPPGPWFSEGSRELTTHRTDFLSRVAEVCRLRSPSAQVEEVRPKAGEPYLVVHATEASVLRTTPIAVADRELTEPQLESLRTQIFAHYRSLDPTLPLGIVCTEPPSESLVRKARQYGIHIRTFVEFQGIIDFRSYIRRQTAWIERDVIYPPSLYVPQRLRYEFGFDEPRAVPNALDQLLDWLTEPYPRFILVLGDFGAGKTFLLHEAARRMPAHLVPMLIELRSLEKSRTLDELIAQHLAAAGERYIDLAAFPYMLREGRIVLLFDGFDELAQRVTYQRAMEHFDTLTRAAEGLAKIVVTCRTQHFESDRQLRAVKNFPGFHLARLDPFDESQIQAFLENLLREKGDEAARQRYDLIRDIRDLLGLSHNPRMLSFIAALPEEQLREAQARSGKITAAELYRILIENWLTHEVTRIQPKGSAPTLTVQERWRAVTAVALKLWPRLECTIRLAELTEEVARTIDGLTEKQLDRDIAAHLVGSGTLLIRDAEGNFAFVHQSVMEWLVANHAAEALKAGRSPDYLVDREMSPLMADFFCDLAGRDQANTWAAAVIAAPQTTQSFAKANAHRVFRGYVTADYSGQILRGKDFSKQNLTAANFSNADLSEARFSGANLTNADFTGATLHRAIFTRAALRNAKLERALATGANFLGADLTGAVFQDAVLGRAKMLPKNASVAPMTSWRSPCNSVSINANGVVASGHHNGSILLWDLESGHPLRVLNGHSSSVLSTCFSPDSRLLASAGDDHATHIWETASGELVHTLSGHTGSVRGVCFSPDSRLLASASEDRTVRLWDVASGQLIRTLTGHGSLVLSVGFSPDSRRLASGSLHPTVRVWDTTSGELLDVWSGHTGSVLSVCFSPDGRRFASGSSDQTVRLLDLASRELVGTLSGHVYSVRSVCFSPDSRLLASASDDHTVRLWDPASGNHLDTLSGHTYSIWSVCFSPDSRRLASASLDDTVRVWDADSRELVHTLSRPETSVSSVAFRSDSRCLAAATGLTVRLWDTVSGALVQTLDSPWDTMISVSFSPDSHWLAGGSADGTIGVWNAASGELIHTLAGHKSNVNSVCFSPDSQLLASGSADNTVRVWDAQSGQLVHTISGHRYTIFSVCFSPDSGRLATGSADNTVRVWDADFRSQVHTLSGHEDYVRSVCFSPDSLHLASATVRTVRVWDAHSGKLVRTLSGHTDRVRSVCFSPDSARVASGGDDKTVRVWHFADDIVHTLSGHASAVVSVYFSPDGRLLASGSVDNTIRLWDAATGTHLATLLATTEGWAAFTPAGKYKVTGNLGGAFWYAVGMVRYEPGELDEFVPPGSLIRLQPGDPLF